jgi:uncharacterized protein YqgC (DUF456 family)
MPSGNPLPPEAGLMETAVLVLLVASFITGLVMVPLGLPGLWIMVLGLAGAGWLEGFHRIGAGTLGLAAAFAVVGEIVETWVGFRYTRKYGGSRRAGWGALLGGLAGAVVGVPVPIVGSVIGSLVGAFAGAVAFEYTGSRRTGAALGVGWGALLGRVWATAAKTALGIAIAVVGVVAVLGR